jgi:predicted phage tail protein
MSVGHVTTMSVSAPNGVFALSVRASNAAGTGPESASVTVTVPQAVAAPGAPTNLAVSVSGTTAQFSWVPASTGGSVTSHLLVAGTTPGFALPIASITLGSMPGTTISGIPPGTYYVRVLAVNAAGISGPSNEVTVTVSLPSLPGAPTLSPAMVSGNTVSLSWMPGSGGTPMSYLLAASATPNGSAITTVLLTGTSATFSGVPGGTYYLRLRAVNAAGTGPSSNEITVVVP